MSGKLEIIGHQPDLGNDQMGWRGQDNRDLANERDFKNLAWRERYVAQRVLWVIAVLLFLIVWVTASMSRVGSSDCDRVVIRSRLRYTTILLPN